MARKSMQSSLYYSARGRETYYTKQTARYYRSRLDQTTSNIRHQRVLRHNILACFPSRPSGVLSLLRWDRADAYVSRFNTWLTPALVAVFLSPQLPVAREYLSPSVINCIHTSHHTTSLLAITTPVIISRHQSLHSVMPSIAENSYFYHHVLISSRASASARSTHPRSHPACNRTVPYRTVPYLALDGSAHDELRALVEAQLEVLAHVLRELSEQLPEQSGEQGPRQVQPLLACIASMVDHRWSGGRGGEGRGEG